MSLSPREQAATLRAAGFSVSVPVWQSGNDHVPVGVI